MSLLAWIIVGLIAGFVAEKIMGRSMGLLGNLAVGVIGAFIGGFVFSLFGGAGVTGFNLYSILVAIVGAVLLLWIAGKVRAVA